MSKQIESDGITASLPAGVEMQPGEWVLDPNHSSLELSARHLMIARVRGAFKRFGATIHVADAPQESWVEASIDAASIDTGIQMRDEHLRSADFLDVAQFPEITFRSRSVVPVSGGRFRLPGDLTIRGVTRPLELEATLAGVVKDPWGNARAVVSASGEIDREDFGMVWNQAIEAGGVLVGPKIRFELEAQAVQGASVKAA